MARVRIGQPLISVRARDQHKAEVIEALRRAKFKFPGRQKVCTRTSPNSVQGGAGSRVRQPDLVHYFNASWCVLKLVEQFLK